MLLLHRPDRRAELVALDDPTGARYGTPLCEAHLARATAPTGWTIVDRRPAAVEEIGHAAAGTPAARTP